MQLCMYARFTFSLKVVNSRCRSKKHTFKMLLPFALHLLRRRHSKRPMLFECWPTVCDVGPVLNQHSFNVSLQDRAVCA